VAGGQLQRGQTGAIRGIGYTDLCVECEKAQILCA